MAPSAAKLSPPEIVYPDSDGKPMADNTKQARWITLIYENLNAMYADDPNVFVAADNLIYPVQGENEICQAPNVYVVLGRPRGDRGSYRYWLEDKVPVTVAFEILSPSNDTFEMTDKLEFYNEHGIEEYYVYNPEKNRLMVYVRQQILLTRVRPVHNFVSPRLGIRFDSSGEELVIRYPDGQPFVRLMEERKRRQHLEQENERLARVVELGRKARRGEATGEELAELDRLEIAE